MTSSVDHELTLHSAASDLGLHSGFTLGFFFSFATIFATLIFFCAIFFNSEPDFEPNFGHFSSKNYLVRKNVLIY